MSVLAAIRRLVRSEEDLATLAIGHVVTMDDRARHGLNAMLGVERQVVWTTQDVQDDLGDGSPRPDLAGYAGSDARAFIEAKFDAGLTAAQPVEYLRRLGEGGHLAMLVPRRRVAYIEHEILRRCSEAAFTFELATDWWNVTTELGGRRLSIVIWDELLHHLLDTTSHPDSKVAHDDLLQIRHLVDEVQEGLFTALTDKQLTDQALPRTFLQLIGLFQDLRLEMPAVGLSSPGNYGAHKNGDHSFTVERGGHPLRWWAYFGLAAWRDLTATPFWLGLHWDVRAEYDHLLRPLLEAAPPRGYEMPQWNTPGVAIPLGTIPGADRAATIESLAKQIRSWIDWGEERFAEHNL